MCGACGQTVVADPLLGPVRTLRQHLIVAQAVNDICRSWPGASKVAATSGGWLVTGPTGASGAVSTVEMLWTVLLQGRPAAEDSAGLFAHSPDCAAADVPSRVRALGLRLAQELSG